MRIFVPSQTISSYAQSRAVTDPLIISLHPTMWLLIALAVILVGLTHWFLNGTYGYWKKRGVPSPPTKPWVGNLGQSIIMTKPLEQIYGNMYNDYKDYLYIGFYKMQKPALLIRDMDLIKNVVIKDFSSFHDNDIEVDETVDPIFARNPFVLKGQRWKVVRSHVTSAITTAKIKNMFNIMANVGQSLVTYLNNNPEAHGKDGLETRELAAMFTTDIVAACAFGLEGKSFSDPDAEFRKMGRRMFSPSLWIGLKFSLMFISPWLMRFFKVKLMDDEVSDWFTGTLSETIKYREKNEIKRNDYFDMMLSLKTKSGEFEFTDLDVIAQAMTFFFDGFETSSVALSFTLYEIAKHPNVQDKLRQEVDRVLGKHGGEITYDAIQEMSYMDMVISESLRKYPPGMFLSKICTKQYTLPAPKGEGSGPDVVVNCGTPIVVPIYSIHHDPQFFPNPDQFDPERFTDEAKQARPKCAYMPFGDGPRMCLGYRFAMAQMKAALASVIYNFDLKINPKTTPTFEMDQTSFLIAKKGGLWLNYYKRTK